MTFRFQEQPSVCTPSSESLLPEPGAEFTAGVHSGWGWARFLWESPGNSGVNGAVVLPALGHAI